MENPHADMRVYSTINVRRIPPGDQRPQTFATACGNVLRRVFRLQRLSACGTSDDVSSDLGASATARAERLSTYLPTLGDSVSACGNVRRRVFRLKRLSACGTSDDVPTWAPQRMRVRKRPLTYRLERLSALRVRKRPSTYLPTSAPQRMRNVLRRTDFGRRSACGNVL